MSYSNFSKNNQWLGALCQAKDSGWVKTWAGYFRERRNTLPPCFSLSIHIWTSLDAICLIRSTRFFGKSLFFHGVQDDNWMRGKNHHEFPVDLVSQGKSVAIFLAAESGGTRKRQVEEACCQRRSIFFICCSCAIPAQRRGKALGLL